MQPTHKVVPLRGRGHQEAVSRELVNLGLGWKVDSTSRALRAGWSTRVAAFVKKLMLRKQTFKAPNNHRIKSAPKSVRRRAF
jgi:hypothetical protein